MAVGATPFGRTSPKVAVFAPSLFLTVTVEPHGPDGEDAEIHLHPGGQGFWIARQLTRLDVRPVLCGLAGGESGIALKALLETWDIDFDLIQTEAPTACHIDDRRSGERTLVARDTAPSIDRHEVDDLYGRVLGRAMAAEVCVVTGRYPGEVMPLDVFERLGADLGRLGVAVVADLHGPELEAFLAGGPIGVLKLSDEEIDGEKEPSAASVAAYATELSARDVDWVVISRAEHGAIASYDGGTYRFAPPMMDVVDHTGAGDAMTAALVVARLRGFEPEEAVRFACAAGAANVTRHGRGGASLALVEGLADRVVVEAVQTAA